MSINFTEAVDKIYEGRHGELSTETFQTIGKSLMFHEQGRTVTEICKELGITPQEARAILIRAAGREIERRQEKKRSDRR